MPLDSMADGVMVNRDHVDKVPKEDDVAAVVGVLLSVRGATSRRLTLSRLNVRDSTTTVTASFQEKLA